MKNTNKQSGFTIIELSLVVIIIFIVSAISIKGLSRYRISQIHRTDAENTLSLLNTARVKALSGEQGRDYNINISTVNNTILLTLVKTDINDPDFNQTILLDTKTLISETIAGSDITFTRFTGSTNNTGLITLTTSGAGYNIETNIRIYPTGLAVIE